mmetsp:Transcript_36698/g.35470  ORF Transcript_36698/g.35470 Transcript_36698/m.35470 type:complete len:124 (+) Transcript_36698:322-693(+)
MVKESKMKERDAFIIVFDLSEKNSFETITKHFSLIESHHPEMAIPVVIVGNKCDRPRAVSEMEIEEKLLSLNCQYLECSALTGSNVNEVFFTVVRELRKRQNELKQLQEPLLEQSRDSCCAIF